jgi:predicted Zn-dependent protease with MMP-like domain
MIVGSQVLENGGMDRSLFEKLISSAIRELPEEFRSKLQNIAIIVEDYPSKDLLEQMGVSADDTLFGVYDGVPLTERGFFEAPLHPDRILIFQRAIEDECDSPEEIKEELKITLVHEIAHFFGMGDDYLEEIGY